MPCVRGREPAELAANAPKWTAEWLARRAADPGARFRWPRAR